MRLFFILKYAYKKKIIYHSYDKFFIQFITVWYEFFKQIYQKFKI